MRVLLVEDEPKLAAFIRKGLSEDSMVVDVAHDGEAALELARTSDYDIVILDIMLPGMDGFTVCGTLRSMHLGAPILMLSARGMIEDRVQGLDAGADDYLTKPFAFSELRARLRALLRRRNPGPVLVLKVSDITLDPLARTVTRAERRVDLTPKEFDLLAYFMKNAGHVLTRAMIAEAVWNFTWDRLTNVIDVFVNHLRRKLEDAGEPRVIHSVRGVGYVMRAQEAVDA
ncbi:MAG TPA: response regulator transcription factor [Gemmatimonadaceae bacterium]|nr:response regulator transcription factor [Gemmatimonadaceae bacterium]